tara:strand:- start:21137 stop:22951 length:1815 start_codon:yes stop_codon:yes gene_type:complete
MAANSATQIAELDFEGIKTNLVTFLQSQSNIKDYDYTGSNISTVLDVLAYNTYLNNFYLNMVANEMFLDTAQERDSIISHIKELNYTPRSFHSSKAVINLQVYPTERQSLITVPKYTPFTTSIAGVSKTFTTENALVIKPSVDGLNNTQYVASNVDIFEGKVVEEVFAVTSANSFIATISNKEVDTRHLVVKIRESSSSTSNSVWTRADTLFGLSSTSNSYFIEPTQGSKFNITFGDGVFGKKPVQGNLVEISYRSGTGKLGDNGKVFVNSGSIDGHSNVAVSTVTNSIGGQEIESMNDIKFNAPRAFQVQERAVTANDYKILLQREYPQVKNVLAFGGEQLTPPRYGKVILAVDLADADGVPESLKSSIADFFKDKTPVGIDVVVNIPEFLYIEINGKSYYNITTTTQSTSAIATKATNALISFANTNINGFGVTYRNSKALGAVDACDTSISSTEFEVRVKRKLSPPATIKKSYVIDFNNELAVDDILHSTSVKTTYKSAIESTTFTFATDTSAFLVDDGLGNLKIVKTDSSDKLVIILAKAGTVDYKTGKIEISSLLIPAFTGTNLEVKARTVSRNIKSTKGAILQLNASDISITAIPERA